MEFRQIGAGHSAVKLVRDIQRTTAPNRFGLLVADGVWEASVVLDAGPSAADGPTAWLCWPRCRCGRPTRMSHPKVLRASQGMSITVPHLDESIDYRHADYSGRTAIVIGSEKYGVRDDFYAAGYQRIGIPMLGRGTR